MITSVRIRIKVSEREKNNDGGSNFWSLFILIFIITYLEYIHYLFTLFCTPKLKECVGMLHYWLIMLLNIFWPTKDNNESHKLWKSIW